MCGRFSIAVKGKKIEEHWALNAPLCPPDDAQFALPRYNVAPTQFVPVITWITQQGRIAHWARWGFWGASSMATRKKKAVINARSETILQKPSFRSAIAERRCVVPTDGFYEWSQDGQRKQPHHFRRTDGLFGMAGILSRYAPEPGVTGDAVCLLTTQANSLVAPIHNRMPVILPNDAVQEWLDQKTPLSRIKDLCAPYPASEMKCLPLESAVNHVQNEGPDCHRIVSSEFQDPKNSAQQLGFDFRF